MVNKKKPLRQKGKVRLSRAFQELKKGDFVAVDIDRSICFGFPERLQGRTGKVGNKKGRSYLVTINDCTKPKEHIISPVHLKKINTIVPKK